MYLFCFLKISSKVLREFFENGKVLCPPKPNVLLRAALTTRSWGHIRGKIDFGQSPIEFIQIDVGGTILLTIARMEAIASTKHRHALTNYRHGLGGANIYFIACSPILF
jgi:hypothetical protein